jgi:CHAT domain-containing protein
MHTKILSLSMAVVFVYLLACQNKEKPPEQTTGRKPTMAEPSSADTTLAGRYFAQAEQLAKAAKYDSAIIHFEKAGELYQAHNNWEKHVSCLNQIGEQIRQNGEYEQARQRLEKALAVGRERLGEDHLEVARSYYYLGAAYRNLGKSGQALDHLQHALAIQQAQLGERHPEVALTTMRIGTIYTMKGDYRQAETLLEKTLSIQLATLGGQHADVTQCYFFLGQLYENMGDYDRYLAFAEKALAINLAIFGERHPRIADGYHDLMVAYRYKGYYDKALDFGKKALSIMLATFGENNINTAYEYREIGLCYHMKGDLDQALIYYEKALSVYTAAQNEYGVADIYDLLSAVYSRKGNHDQALTMLRKALAIVLALQGERHVNAAIIHRSIGDAYHRKGDYDQALHAYTKAISIWRTTVGEKDPLFASALAAAGTVYQVKKDYRQALAFYKNALAVLQRSSFGKQSASLADINNRIGRIYYQKGDYEQALNSLQYAINANVLQFASRDPYTNPPLSNILTERGLLTSLGMKTTVLLERYAKQSGDLRDLKASLAASELSAQLIDNMRRGFKAEGSKLDLAEDAADFYDEGIQIARRLYRATRQNEYNATAFRFAEKSKAGVMLEAFSEAEAKQFAGIPDSLLEKERQVRLDLTFFDQNLTKEKLKGEAGDSAKIARWQDKVFSLKQAYEALLQRFEKDYPDYYSLKYQVETATVEEVKQEVLDENTALVEYFTGKDSIFIFAITKDNFAIATSAKDSLFDKQIEQLRQGLVTQDFVQYAQAAYRLYQTLLAPVADQLAAKNLIIIPDAALSGVPFEALLTEQGTEGKEQVASGKATPAGLQDYMKLPYLINDHAVSYAYSATLLQQEQARKNRETKRDYLAFAPVFANGLPVGTRGGDFFKENFAPDSSQTAAATASAPATRLRGYLPSTKKEVAGILNAFENHYGLFERWFGSKAQVYLEREAKEENLKLAGLGDYRYVHFATHGLVNEKNPKLSGLLLAQEDTTSKEDGILHLGEIYNLNLNADLVVLSACETGLGQVAKGEGIIGLTRGFLYAGASNLLVSLWQVSDVTTADLMMDFYDKMLGGMSKPDALREAKLQMIRRHPEYAKPYYWAPFILVGR